jgi:hypothetical protein
MCVLTVVAYRIPCFTGLDRGRRTGRRGCLVVESLQYKGKQPPTFFLLAVCRLSTRSTHSFFTALCSPSAFSDSTCNTVCVVHMRCIDIGSYEYDINDLKRPLAQTGNNELRTLGVCTAVELKLYGVCRELKTTRPIQLCIHSICYLDTLFFNQEKAYRQEKVVPRSSPAQRGTTRNAAGIPDR